MSFSRYDEDGALTIHHTHCCIGARRAAHCATGDDINIQLDLHIYHNIIIQYTVPKVRVSAFVYTIVTVAYIFYSSIMLKCSVHSQNIHILLNACELCSGIANGRVLSLELYTYRIQKLTLLHLLTFLLFCLKSVQHKELVIFYCFS